MGERYNNPLNIEIVNYTNSWSGQIGVYADGYGSIADRKAKQNYNPANNRHLKLQAFTDVNGDTTYLSGKEGAKLREELIKVTSKKVNGKHLSWQQQQEAIKEVIYKKYPGKKFKTNGRGFDFSKPFAHFDSRITGLRAGFRLFKGSGYLGGGRNNLRDIINRFAPGSENNVDAYVAHITKRMRMSENGGGGKPNFDGTLTLEDVPNMVRFFMEHENDAEYESYYLTEEALAYDWKVAAWASQEDKPMNFTSKMFETGYKQSIKPKIQKDEVSNLYDSDGNSYSGGSRSLATMTKEEFAKNSYASNVFTGDIFIQDIGSDLYETGVGGSIRSDKDGIYGSAQTIMDDKAKRVTDIDFETGFKGENIDINVGKKGGETTSRIQFKKDGLTVQTDKRGDDRRNLIRYKRGGLEVEATESDGKKGFRAQYSKEF